jgi:flavin reductase (DIM6/NTAB) family NADH-FMN oxidoreductase RutF
MTTRAVSTATPLKEFPLNRAFTFFESGPVLLITTYYRNRPNVMTASWHTLMEFTPKLGVMLGAWNFSYASLLKTGECVVAVPGADLLKKTVAIGNCSGADLDKFAKFNLTPLAASAVKAPLIGECLMNLECRVIKKSVGGTNLMILEGLRAWHNPRRKEQRAFHARGDGVFIIDGPKINLRRQMTKWQGCI